MPSSDNYAIPIHSPTSSEISPTHSPSAFFCKKSIEETISELGANSETGLSISEVEKRTKQYGNNELEEETPEPLYMKFLEQLKQPLILLLLGSAAVSLLLGQYDDAFSITLAILIVVTVAFVQEYRSEKSLESLNKLVPHYCHVVRESHSINLLAQELVPGDLVHFSTGDRIPADIRLIQTVDLEVDESNLSGETKPSRKISTILPPTNDSVVPVAERKNIVFMGTLVRGGNGKGIVIATGKHTEFGMIWSMMKEVGDKKTPLQLKMEELGKQLSFLSFCIIGFITLLGVIQKREILETFTIAVSLAVAAIPEGLPIVVTVTLALGVMRMAKKNAIVKKLPSVESLGSVNIVCADKTGTLTMNKMTVTELFTITDGIKSINQDSSPNLLTPSIQKLLQIGSLCNNAEISGEERIGQPTEIALLELNLKLNRQDDRKKYKRLSEIPFDSEQKWMAVQYDIPNVGVLHFLKGAPEIILGKCQKFFTPSDSSTTFDLQQQKLLTNDLRNSVLSTVEHLSTKGLRVLAFAYGSAINDLIFAGLVAIVDPPKPKVAETIQQLQQSGIRVLMLTGDSEGTALSIAKQLNLINYEPSANSHLGISGQQLDQMDEGQLLMTAKNCTVFYRTTPKHKLMLVKALQSHHYVVAMTGDGVNDGPSLKQADIGVSMGITGTDVSKEAADMILVDDNLSTILAAIEEGKSIFYNIRNFLRFQLSTSVAALSLIALSTLFGLHTPLNAMQILWINIIMDGPPAQSLGVEPVDHDVMKKPPRPKNEPILDCVLIQRVLTSAFFMVAGTLLIYRSEMIDGQVTARDTTMTFTTFVLFDMFNAISCRSEKKSVFQIGFLTNKPLIYAITASLFCQLCVIYVPFFQKIFQTEALSTVDLLKITLLSSSVWIVDEMRKWWQNGRSFVIGRGRFYDLKRLSEEVSTTFKRLKTRKYEYEMV